MRKHSKIPLRYRGIRALRMLSRMKGWHLVSLKLAGPDRFTSDVPKTIVRAYGKSLHVTLNSFIEWSIYSFGGYESGRIDAFRRATNGNGVLLDIGANIGNHSLALSSHFQEIHSFEPSPSIFARLKENISLNPGVRITATNAGLGNVRGELRFYKPEWSNQGMGTFVIEEAVEPYTILDLPIVVGDDYVAVNLQARSITAIKIDVQGFEPEVLLGLKDTILKHRPAIWMEVSEATRGRMDVLPVTPTRIQRFTARQRFGVWHYDELRLSNFEEMKEHSGDYFLEFG